MKIKNIINHTLNMILPPRCIGSGDIVSKQGTFSPAFWGTLHFINDPFCKTCGVPFDFDTPENTLCVSCMDIEPHFMCARAPLLYNDASKKIILAFKYGDRLHSLQSFVPLMIQSGKELIEKADVIIPIPLHNSRLRERRFNQSALLTQELGRQCKKNFTLDGLLRTRATIPQQGLSRKDRQDNVKNAFEINKKHAEKLKYKNILLIDDVFTSGATLNECARILVKNKVAEVNILTIARVSRDNF